MSKVRRGPRENARQRDLEQTLVMLYRATYRAGRRLDLPPEDSKDAAMKEAEDYFVEWVQAADCDIGREPNAMPLLSEEEIRRRASAAASAATRKYRRDREHRVDLSGSDAEDAQSYAGIADPSPSPHAEIQQREFLEAVVASLAEFPGDTGEQLWEHHVGRVSWADLGRLHGCTPEAIRQRLLRALPHIQEELARLGWDETGSA